MCLRLGAFCPDIGCEDMTALGVAHPASLIYPSQINIDVTDPCELYAPVGHPFHTNSFTLPTVVSESNDIALLFPDCNKKHKNT
jgi:hypothetical protein